MIIKHHKKKFIYVKPKIIARKVRFSLFLSSRLLACCFPAECGRGLCGVGDGCLPGWRCVLQCCTYP